MGWFYAWSARTEDGSWHFGQRQTDYYNLLVDGMLDGHLSLKVAVPPQLLAVKDPYDPANRPPGLALHDASLYHGRYYLYFGAAPVVALMLPFRLLTGTALPLPAAIVIFAYAGFLVLAATWWRLRRRYFPDAGVLPGVLMLSALGTASLVPVLVRRANVWELPLSGGYCFSAIAIACVYQSLHASRRALWWLAGASLALGLAVASRPTYLFGAGLLLVPLLAWRRGRGAGTVAGVAPARDRPRDSSSSSPAPAGTGRRGVRSVPPATDAGAGAPLGGSDFWRVLAAAVLPMLAVGLAMAWYNEARFGNPLEFGIRYQFSGIYEAHARHFSLAYLPYNLRLYGFARFAWSAYFPFLHPARLPVAPAGYYGTEQACGVLWHLPLVWLALVAPLALLRRGVAERRALGTWLAATAALGIGTLLILACFYAAIARYETDFMPSLVLLGTVGALAWERTVRRVRPMQRWFGRIAVGVILAWSAVFGALFSLVLYGNFQRLDGADYARLARWCDYPAHWLERWHGVTFGAVDLTLRLPAAPARGRESLVETGGYGEADHVFIEYGDGGRLRLGYAHDGGGDVFSRWIHADPAAVHRLRVALGSLYPPEEDPTYRRWPVAVSRRVTRRLHVEFDGDVLLDAYERFEAGGAMPVRIGGPADLTEFGTRFTGQILASRRDPRLTPIMQEEVRRIAVQFALANVPAGATEPLLGGRVGGTAVVWFVRSVAGGIVVGYHGRPDGAASARIPCDPTRLHRLEIASTVAPDAGDHTRALTWVTLDGVPGWTTRSAGLLVPDAAVIGRNPTVDRDCAARFAGRIVRTETTEAAAHEATTFDRISMRVALPETRPIGAREPIVTAGVTGGADFLYLVYLDATHVRFGLEHWGKAGIFSPVVTWPGPAPRRLDIALGSFPAAVGMALAARDHVTLRLDGTVIWSSPARFYHADSADVFVGRNPVGGTACRSLFSGTMTSVRRLSGPESR